MSPQTSTSPLECPPAGARCEGHGCRELAASVLESRNFCLEHFLAAAYAEIESRNDRLKTKTYNAAASEEFRAFLGVCSRQAKRLAELTSASDPKLQARLLDILLRAADLTARLRRGPRIEASLPVWLRREDPGRTWEEESCTTAVSRHGAGLECRHFIEAGGTLVVSRRDNGRTAKARVAYCRFDAHGRRQVGIEFLDREDFWELDANSAQVLSNAAFRRKSKDDTTGRRVTPAAGGSKMTRARQAPVECLDEAARWIQQEREFWHALEKKDIRALRRFCSDHFVWVSESGRHERRAVLDNTRDLHNCGAVPDNFQVAKLSDHFVLVTYRASRTCAGHKESVNEEWHTSLWHDAVTQAQIALHQVSQVPVVGRR